MQCNKVPGRTGATEFIKRASALITLPTRWWAFLFLWGGFAPWLWLAFLFLWTGFAPWLFFAGNEDFGFDIRFAPWLFFAGKEDVGFDIRCFVIRKGAS
jgi:hypothetical protein